MTTFITITSKPEILKAAEFIIREGEAQLGRQFVLWDAAAYEIDYCNRQQYPADSNIEYWEEQKSLVPTPPKVGIKVTGRHSSIQVEDIFHWSITSGDDFQLSSDGNYVKYKVASALLELMRTVGNQVVIEIVDWSSAGIYQQLLDEAWRRQRQSQRRRPRRRRRNV